MYHLIKLFAGFTSGVYIYQATDYWDSQNFPLKRLKSLPCLHLVTIEQNQFVCVFEKPGPG